LEALIFNRSANLIQFATFSIKIPLTSFSSRKTGQDRASAPNLSKKLMLLASCKEFKTPFES
jgi:hypothetical protein